jgi:hypothetical protein
VTHPPSPGSNGALSGIAAVSPSLAWAVGAYTNAQQGQSTLLARWDGSAWTRVPSPNPGELTGVAATSATNAWAVGYSDPLTTLILHWNGTIWKLGPVPATATGLSAVAAPSPTNLWTVGSTEPTNSTLALHHC